MITCQGHRERKRRRKRIDLRDRPKSSFFACTRLNGTILRKRNSDPSFKAVRIDAEASATNWRSSAFVLHSRIFWMKSFTGASTEVMAMLRASDQQKEWLTSLSQSPGREGGWTIFRRTNRSIGHEALPIFPGLYPLTSLHKILMNLSLFLIFKVIRKGYICHLLRTLAGFFGGTNFICCFPFPSYFLPEFSESRPLGLNIHLLLASHPYYLVGWRRWSPYWPMPKTYPQLSRSQCRPLAWTWPARSLKPKLWTIILLGLLR